MATRVHKVDHCWLLDLCISKDISQPTCTEKGVIIIYCTLINCGSRKLINPPGLWFKTDKLKKKKYWFEKPLCMPKTSSLGMFCHLWHSPNKYSWMGFTTSWRNLWTGCAYRLVPYWWLFYEPLKVFVETPIGGTKCQQPQSLTLQPNLTYVK